MRTRVLWEDLHGGDRRLLRQPLRQRCQVPSPRGGPLPVSPIILLLVIKCVNGGVGVPRVGQLGVSQVPLHRHRHPLTTNPLQRCLLYSLILFPSFFLSSSFKRCDLFPPDTDTSHYVSTRLPPQSHKLSLSQMSVPARLLWSEMRGEHQ